MKPWQFRNATTADWPAITGLLSEAHLPLEGAHQHIAGFLLAYRGDTLVGCGALERYESAGLLRALAVSGSERGEGLGQEIVRRLTESAALDAITRVFLLTSTASAYFRRFGFRLAQREEMPDRIKEAIDFLSGWPPGAEVMLLDLSANRYSYATDGI